MDDDDFYLPISIIPEAVILKNDLNNFSIKCMLKNPKIRRKGISYQVRLPTISNDDYILEYVKYNKSTTECYLISPYGGDNKQQITSIEKF